jgi:2-methylisocitrate lyase-like PEP mutase family enzyme
VIIARSDACREQGYKEAVKRMRMARDQGADMGLIFPRTPEETKRAPKDCKLPMVYVQSRGNRDGRPLYSFKQLEDMGYAGSIDAILSVGVQFHFMRKALLELKKTGDYTGISAKDYVTARKQIEDLIGLEEYYRIERETVEMMHQKKKRRKR